MHWDNFLVPGRTKHFVRHSIQWPILFFQTVQLFGKSSFQNLCVMAIRGSLEFLHQIFMFDVSGTIVFIITGHNERTNQSISGVSQDVGNQWFSGTRQLLSGQWTYVVPTTFLHHEQGIFVAKRRGRW
jgi:hypothetical protein